MEYPTPFWSFRFNQYFSRTPILKYITFGVAWGLKDRYIGWIQEVIGVVFLSVSVLSFDQFYACWRDKKIKILLLPFFGRRVSFENWLMSVAWFLQGLSRVVSFCYIDIQFIRIAYSWLEKNKK